MRAEFWRCARNADRHCLPAREPVRRNRRLFAFDMDSTLIQGEVIDELAKMAGVADQVVKIPSLRCAARSSFRRAFGVAWLC